MSIGRHDDNLSRLPTEDSDRGMLFRVVLIVGICAIAGGGLYFAAGSAHGEKSDSVKIEKTSTPTPIEREIIALKRQVADLRADNDALRAEVTTLTSQNGVVDTIITHLRELKAQDQAIIGLIQPGGNGYSAQAGNDGEAPADEAVFGNARHQIVTPKAKAPPVPTPKPEKVAEASAAGDKPKEDAAATQ